MSPTLLSIKYVYAQGGLMSTDSFKSMCAELVDSLHKHTSMWEGHEIDLVARARALLAQPAAEEPTDDEVDAWADANDFVQGHGDHPCGFWIKDDDLGMIVRSALARWGRPTTQPVPEPEEPTKAEIHAIADALLDGDSASRIDFARAVLARWGCPTPQPVPVSERLPGPEDCDAEGRCWIYMPDIGTDPSWRLVDPRDIGPYHTHWLPANALPTPETKP